MLSFLNRYAKNIHSQNGEDGILAEVLSRLGFEAWQAISDERASSEENTDGLARQPGHCIEVGGNDGQWMSNTRLLLEYGWSGLFVEADYNLYLKSKENWSNNPRVRHQCSRVDGNNINAFVDEGCDLLSIDTDGHDYEIFRGLRARPKIVIVEVDSSIEPPSEQFNSDGGAGYWSMTTLALEKGYFVLCHTGNLCLVRQDYGHLFPECKPHPLLEWELYFNRAWLTT